MKKKLKFSREQLKSKTYGAYFRRRGTDVLLDVTAKSAKGLARSLAPTWGMVREYKAAQKKGGKTEEKARKDYRQKYSNIFSMAWEDGFLRKILQKAARRGDRLVFLCYCPDGAFCHTVLLKKWCRKYQAQVIARTAINP